MSDDSYVFEGAAPAEPARDNNPPLSISDLSFALKRTLEERFGHVRLRGEISKVNRHASGHVYLTLKDDKAAIDGVIWKGSARSLGVQPETGLEVIVTGKITSYPARSSYQIVIETMEAAGAGALLAQLERLKTKLRDEGLFETSRKRPIPAFPAVIGVITSPTGAVIRDILHRIAERWPCRVIVWPVVVQGDQACGQVANAIRGFDALARGGPIPRPDLLIVARGGGSVEDLWCFNDEGLARTVAAAAIPIISAVGHETDTTLIDFVSDRRAPTPTGAAEMATPVLADLRYALSDLSGRLARSAGRLVEDRRTRLRAAARGLPARPEDLLSLAQQRLDMAGGKLRSSLQQNVSAHRHDLVSIAGRLNRGLLDGRIENRGDRLTASGARLSRALKTHADAKAHALGRIAARLSDEPLKRRLDQRAARLEAAGRSLGRWPDRLTREDERLSALARALLGLDPARPKPGFARVEAEDGRWITQAAALAPGQAVSLVFPDGARGARIDGESAAPPPRPRLHKPKPTPPGQGDLF
ncbi:MAG: exodeoxyribonuclease VII large subunit [Brevundimonas sp.]|uniref:exodeoxyribonuclease VII large subunit n=1 Tax=Brevundimonas sp. TaxID=1871086 RepID=UPI0025C69563|nr:exodeoxyribonuclease VII large subunit [Brevundimonas sp.]MBX3477800.1 exodeoxyribonuclease VII large subunit [Brevundimonas sp.]